MTLWDFYVAEFTDGTAAAIFLTVLLAVAPSLILTLINGD